MCGIVGYVGDRDCADVLVDALSKLEYRGYVQAELLSLKKELLRLKNARDVLLI